MTQGGAFHVALGGAGAGQFDQIVISPTGTVRFNGGGGIGNGLGGVALNLSVISGFTPTVGQQFKIIDNQSSSGVIGKFFGPVNQGGTITVNSTYIFTVSYTGGDGNDVVLTFNGLNAGSFSKFALSVQGGNTVVAGNAFLLTAQAVDALGNPVSGADVPTNIMVTASPADPQGNFPISAPVNSSGFAFLLGNLQTAGSYTITAGGAGTSVVVASAGANYFTVTAPATATTGTPVNVTVKAFDRFGNAATGYTGTVNITSTDPAALNLLPNPYTFVAGDNGVHTFSVTLNSSTLGHVDRKSVV
jgi:hypothetical protein